MSGDSLGETLSRLHRCQEAADIIYSRDAARTLAEPATPQSVAHGGAAEDFSLIVARRIGTAVARLNDLASPSSQLVLTPRMVLCELMDILRQTLYVCFPATLQKALLPTDKAGVVSQFNSYASSRQVPLEAAAEGLYTVSYVSVKLRVELVVLQLRRRIQEELQKKDAQTSESSIAALVVTETLLEDLMVIYNNIVLTLPITKAAGVHLDHGKGGSDTAATAADRLVPVFFQYYYQLCDWILVLESTMKGPVMSYTQVRRLALDEQRGSVVVDLHRPTPQTAWGLLLNEQGRLVDVDVSLRIFDKAKQLHVLLQAAPEGAIITKINDQPISHAKGLLQGGGDYAAYTQKVLETLQTATATRKHVQLTLQSTAFKAAARTMPTEVAFVAPPQGGEGTSGQRVTLVLRRQSTAAAWGFSVDERLYWHPPPARVLSDASRVFMKEYSRHLRLLALNGVEALHTTQVELLMESAETVVLELLVMPSFSQSRRGASKVASSAADVAAASTEAVVGDTTGESTVKNERTPTSVEEARAAPRKRASVDDAALRTAVQRALKSSSGAAETSGIAGVQMETPYVDGVADIAAAAVAVAKEAHAKTKAKRGRPARPPLASAPAEERAGEAPHTASPVAEETEKEKPKRGRPKKVAAESQEGKEPHIDTVKPAKPRTTASTVDVNDDAVQRILNSFADDATPALPAPAAGRARKSKEKMSAPRGAASPPAVDKAKATVDAALLPCVFDNAVQLTHLTEEEMVLERPSVSAPWGLPIGRIADASASPQQLPLRLMSLPPAKKALSQKHPFLTQFKKQPATWYIAEVNGKPASNAEATLQSIGTLTKMTLRFLRK